jgi:hypothetical protein
MKIHVVFAGFLLYVYAKIFRGLAMAALAGVILKGT